MSLGKAHDHSSGFNTKCSAQFNANKLWLFLYCFVCFYWAAVLLKTVRLGPIVDYRVTSKVLPGLSLTFGVP